MNPAMIFAAATALLELASGILGLYQRAQAGEVSPDETLREWQELGATIARAKDLWERAGNVHPLDPARGE